MLSDRGHAEMCIFQHVTVSSYSPQKLIEATEMGSHNLFEASDPLVENFQIFATKWFLLTLIHILLPNVVEIGKMEVTKL